MFNCTHGWHYSRVDTLMREIHCHAVDISIFNRDGNKDYSVRYRDMRTAALAFQGEGTVTLTFRAEWSEADNSRAIYLINPPDPRYGKYAVLHS